jgi:hypothetical protein
LKKVQEKNKKAKALEEEKREKLRQEGLLKDEQVRSLVDQDHDEDILF